MPDKRIIIDPADYARREEANAHVAEAFGQLILQGLPQDDALRPLAVDVIQGSRTAALKALGVFSGASGIEQLTPEMRERLIDMSVPDGLSVLVNVTNRTNNPELQNLVSQALERYREIMQRTRLAHRAETAEQSA